MLDPLSEVLRAVRLTGGVFLDARFTAPWCVTAQLAPVLPHLTDSEEHLDAALAQIAAAGASGVTVIALHLRPGAREWFFAWLAREKPELLPAYRALYSRGSEAAPSYRRWLAARARPILRRYGLGGQGMGLRDVAPTPRPAKPRQADKQEQLTLL